MQKALASPAAKRSRDSAARPTGPSKPSKTKQNQALPNKTKQNSLVLFGFIRPNRDFSMGYAESK
jgi:hypothetical protein